MPLRALRAGTRSGSASSKHQYTKPTRNRQAKPAGPGHTVGYPLPGPPGESMDDQDRENIGRTVGVGAGMASGALLGGRLIPVPLVGPFIGGVLGAAVGSELGWRFGKAIL